MNQIQTEVIFLNLLRQADEFVFSILGTNPTPDAGSFRARVVSLYHTFQADKPAFVASSVHLGFLATLLKEYAAFRLSPIEQIGTPEILIGQIRWEDIYDKPDIVGGASDWEEITNKPATFPPDAHAHAYADLTSKPATFPPDTHAHAYADITGKPATFPPDTHAHAYADITSKPATFPPDTHAHAYADLTRKPSVFPSAMVLISYVGNAAGSRTLSHSGGVAVRYIICVWSQYLKIWDTVSGLSNITTDSFTLTGANTNESGISYKILGW